MDKKILKESVKEVFTESLYLLWMIAWLAIIIGTFAVKFYAVAIPAVIVVPCLIVGAIISTYRDNKRG